MVGPSASKRSLSHIFMSIFDTGSSKTKVMVKDVGNGKEEMGIGKQKTIIKEEGVVEEGVIKKKCVKMKEVIMSIQEVVIQEEGAGIDEDLVSKVSAMRKRPLPGTKQQAAWTTFAGQVIVKRYKI